MVSNTLTKIVFNISDSKAQSLMYTLATPVTPTPATCHS